MGVGLSSTLLSALGTFSPTALLSQVLLGGLSPCIIVSFFVLLDCHLLENCSFLKGNGSVERGGKSWEEKRDGKQVGMREESIFQEK